MSEKLITGEQLAENVEKLSKTGIQLINAADVEYVPPRFLINPYIQSGVVNIIQGDSSAGKTAFMCGIAALVTTGGKLCGIPCECGNVLMLSTEDNLGVLKQRVEGSGGDVNKVFFTESITNFADIVKIESAIKAIDAKLVVFDPIQAFLGAKVDMNRANEMRSILAPLAKVAERTECAIVIICHTGKNRENKAIHKALGSVDIGAVSRSVIHIGEIGSDGERLAVHVKENEAKTGMSIAYKICAPEGHVEWEYLCNKDMDDINAASFRRKIGMEYENMPITSVIRQLITENPGGLTISYNDFETAIIELLGHKPYDTQKGMRSLLEGIKNDALTKDHIAIILSDGNRRPKAFTLNNAIITPEKTTPTRCVELRNYEAKDAFQVPMQTDGKRL